MKKLILASAFALMATPALFAQTSNSYSMQIELKDGTKITLGPNDLKNITFADGAIKIEGNTIEDLRMAIEKAEANTKNMVEEQRYNLDDVKKQAVELQVMIDYLSDKVAKLENAGGGSGNTEDITALQAAIATLQSRSSEMATKMDVAATNEKINNVQAMVKATEAAIMDLQKAVKDLSSGSSGSGSVGNEERIKLLEEAVNNLKADMKNLSSIEEIKQLQDQIYNLQAMVNVVATNSTGNQALADELKARMTAVEAAMANLNNNVSDNQAAINQIKMESVDAKNRIAETKAELQERIMSIRNELLEVLAKTNNNLDSVSVTLLQKTQAEFDQLAAAINAVNKESRTQAANLENKIETLDGYTKSMRTTLEGLIEKEKNDRMISINEVNKTILENYNELKEELYWITKFLNSEAFPAANTFDNWLKEIQQR